MNHKNHKPYKNRQQPETAYTFKCGHNCVLPKSEEENEFAIWKVRSSSKGASWICRICHKAIIKKRNQWRYKNEPAFREHRDTTAKEWYAEHRDGLLQDRRQRRLDNRAYYIWIAARARARNKGLDFDIEVSDIPPLPSHCSVLGIELCYDNAMMKDNSPSLDRIDSTKGYIRGNIRIISRRANTIKSNASVEELRKVYEDAAQVSQTPPHTEIHIKSDFPPSSSFAFYPV